MSFSLLKKGDFILIALLSVIFISSLFIFKIWKGNNEELVALISQDGRIIRTIYLDKVIDPERINITGKYNEIILVEKGRIRFLEAPCPDKVCVKTGWLTKSGDIAVCAPNKTLIKIVGKKTKVDVVTW